MDRYLDEQLERLATDHIDFYLVHGLNQDRGRIPPGSGSSNSSTRQSLTAGSYPAFSFHDSLPLFKEIVDAYDWTFAQIQYNFMDEQYQAGTEGLNTRRERGIGIVVMEPLRGGLLAKDAARVAGRFLQTGHGPAHPGRVGPPLGLEPP